MSPLLQALMDETECTPLTEEYKALTREIIARQAQIAQALSPEFLEHYSDLHTSRIALENEVCFERGFFTCAQLFVEILSKYSS